MLYADMIFCALTAHNSLLTVHCIGSFPSVRPVYQRWQLAVRFYSRWCIRQSGVGALAKKKRCAVTEVVQPNFTY